VLCTSIVCKQYTCALFVLQIDLVKHIFILQGWRDAFAKRWRNFGRRTASRFTTVSAKRGLQGCHDPERRPGNL
jgi:hypothetical protein